MGKKICLGIIGHHRGILYILSSLRIRLSFGLSQKFVKIHFLLNFGFLNRKFLRFEFRDFLNLENWLWYQLLKHLRIIFYFCNFQKKIHFLNLFLVEKFLICFRIIRRISLLILIDFQTKQFSYDCFGSYFEKSFLVFRNFFNKTFSLF